MNSTLTLFADTNSSLIVVMRNENSKFILKKMKNFSGVFLTKIGLELNGCHVYQAVEI